MCLVKLLRRGDGVQSAYERSAIAGFLRWLFNLIVRAVRAVYTPAARLAQTSVIVRLCRGSVFLNFEFLLGAFICAMFVMPHEMWNNAYFVLAAFGFLALYLILVGCGKRSLLTPDKLGFPFILFAVIVCLSLLFSHARADSLRIIMFLVASFIFTYVIASDISDDKRLTKLMAFIYAAVILTSFYAIAQRMFGLVWANELYTDLNINGDIPGRVTSTLDNPNNYAEFLVLFMPLCAAFAGSRKSTLPCVLLFLGLAFPALALLMTYSRSGWISLMLAVFVYVWLRNKKLLPVFLVLAVAAVPFLPASIMSRIASMFTSFTSTGYVDSSFSHRLYLWDAVGHMIQDFGITGIGLGPKAFAAVYPDYTIMGANDGAYHTQSLYLELMLSVGFLGFAAFIWMVLRSIKCSIIACRSTTGAAHFALIACISSFIGIAFSSIVEYIWFYPRIMFAYFILLGIAYAAANMAPQSPDPRLERRG